MIPIGVGELETVFKSLEKKTGGIGNRRNNQDLLINTNVKIGKNTEKTPGDLSRLALTQIPVKDHQLKLVGITCKL